MLKELFVDAGGFVYIAVIDNSLIHTQNTVDHFSKTFSIDFSLSSVFRTTKHQKPLCIYCVR